MMSATLHGMGRFGQHLLYAWLNNPGSIVLRHCADPLLSAEQFCALLNNHDRLDFSCARPSSDGEMLMFQRKDSSIITIPYYQGDPCVAPWLGHTDLWLECSGEYTDANQARQFVQGKTRQVVISATSRTADQTIVYGFNHADFSPSAHVLSYGSCTVNAFIPIASWLNHHFGVMAADVVVLHNIPGDRVDRYPHPERRPCTLEYMAPQLLHWLDPVNFHVSYTLIPYSGASSLEFNFYLKREIDSRKLVEVLMQATQTTPLSLYQFPIKDCGVDKVCGSSANAVFPLESISVKGRRLTLRGYFDNENSAYRYLDLLQWIASQKASEANRVTESL